MEIEANEDWKDYIVKRCQELESKVLGSAEPTLDEALMFFKVNEVRYNVFGLGRDLSDHPRNPFKKNLEKNLDTDTKISHNDTMTEKDTNIIKFLQKEIQEMSPRVFGISEPLLTDRMTLFAYNQLLFTKYAIGNDLKAHPRNPWKGDAVQPLDFSLYSQIRPLPEDLREKPLAKTQVIPAIKVVATPTIEPLWRVFDVDYPQRTLHQGTEGDCYQYVARANKDTGYKAFDYADAHTTFEPRAKKDTTKVFQTQVHGRHTVHIGGANCGCDTKPAAYTYSYKTSKTKVQEYLARCKTQKEEETAPEKK